MLKLVIIISVAVLIVGFEGNTSVNGELPPNPKTGECYTRVSVPAVYEKQAETIMVKPETYAIKAVPAKYKYINKQVMVKDGYTRTKVIPAKYKVTNKKVLIRDEARKLLPVPAKFKTVSKRVLVTPERSVWKKGSGPIQKVENSTGEILCFTKVPAVYKTIKERVVVSEASVREQIIPAQYKTMPVRELVSPERVIKKEVPAVYKTVSVKALAKPATQNKYVIPAKYKTVYKKRLTRKSFSEWRPILCNTNASRSSIKDVQSRLAHFGYYKGPIDGVYGRQTSKAVLGFQAKNNLASGGLTKETLNKLKVRWPSKVSTL